MGIEPLTTQQAVVITAFTGVLCCDFKDYHAAVEKKLGRPVFSHEFVNKAVLDQIKSAFSDEFYQLIKAE